MRTVVFVLFATSSLVACAASPAPQSPASPDVSAAAGSTTAQLPPGARHKFNVDDMLSFDRVDDPSVSPDGKRVVFTVATPDVAANKMRRDVWVAMTDGTGVRRLTSHPEPDTAARFSADSRSVYFVSDRSGSSQVWRIAVDGGEATQVTSLAVDVGAVMPMPDGKRLLLAIDVFPDAPSLEDSAAREKAAHDAKVKVKTYDHLPIRHWDAWDDGRRTHLFVFAEGASQPIDLMKGLDADAPTKPFGGLEEIAIAKDGSEIVFTAKMVGREDAWSTNSDLWVVPSDGSKKPRSITSQNPATDTRPAFSHDGTKLAYVAMARPGYESDRTRLVVMDWKTKQPRIVSDAWDRSVEEVTWSADDKSIFTTSEDLGRKSLFAIDVASGKATTLLDRGTSSGVAIAGGNQLVFTHDDLSHPAELWTSDAHGGRPHAITHVNDAKLAAIDFGTSEPFTFTGAKGDTVHGWITRPPGLAPNAKAPVAFLIHGGPQGSFGDHFHYRWNMQAFAGHGFATIAIDFHGSTGYGQAFTDAIKNDWGGAPFEDLMKGLDAAIAKYPFVDGSRVTALGASYGGFMINFINGHTDRFKALVCHDGNLDELTAYYDTEELWFPEWEHGGLPWENAEGFQKHSPINFVKNWKTPELVIHGGRDYRVVDTQGMATFTALQRKGVPSRFVYFPDENHWILKPGDTKRWHEEVLAWIDRYTKG